MEINIPDDGLPKMPQFRPGPWTIPVIGLLIGALALSTIFYRVDRDEAGVVKQLGKYVRTTQPGLHMKLPFNIETVQNIRTTHVRKEEFGFRTRIPGVRTEYVDSSNYYRQSQLRKGSSRFMSDNVDPFLQESMMLTGDLNIVVVEWAVQYTVKDPVQYAFNIRNPRGTIRNMSEAVMRLVIGDRTINQVLGSGQEVQLEAADKLQELLDDYESGIRIVNIILQNVTVPNEVKPSFNAVNEAKQEQEKVVNQAWEEYNRVIPRAKGQAEQLLRAAEGYALERINNAQGDAERFLLTLEEYKKAPAVTKQRLYLEMAGKVMPGLDQKLFLDDSQKGIVPLLNLNQEPRGGAES